MKNTGQKTTDNNKNLRIRNAILVTIEKNWLLFALDIVQSIELHVTMDFKLKQ